MKVTIAQQRHIDTRQVGAHLKGRATPHHSNNKKVYRKGFEDPRAAARLSSASPPPVVGSSKPLDFFFFFFLSTSPLPSPSTVGSSNELFFFFFGLAPSAPGEVGEVGLGLASPWASPRTSSDDTLRSLVVSLKVPCAASASVTILACFSISTRRACSGRSYKRTKKHANRRCDNRRW